MSDEKYTNFFDENESNHEEFDKSDVINREEDDEVITNPFETDFNVVPLEEEKPVSDVKPLLTQDDLDLIINYDENKRKNNIFNNEFSQKAKSSNIEPDYPHKNFNDFLILPKISGTQRMPHSSRLPSDFVKQKGEMVEIADAPIKARKKHHSSVIVNREPNGEVDSIEVVCTCGERTLIKFDFAEGNKDFDLTEVFNEKIEDPVDIIEEVDLSGLDIGKNIYNAISNDYELDKETEIEIELMFKNEGIDKNLKATFDRLLENNSVNLFTTY